jgi:hypothetical protein
MAHSNTVTVLVATTRADVYAALARIAPCITREAVTTQGVYNALPGVQFAIVELDALLEENVPRDTLFDILNRAPMPWTDPAGFLDDPARWRSHALAAAGDFKSFPTACVALTSYSGGVGKSTLTLDTAIAFAARTRLPTAVVEFPHGPSAVRALTGIAGGIGFVDIGQRENAALPCWRGVNLVTVNYHEVGAILKPDEVAARFERIRKAHVLTLVDSEYPHPWLDLVAPQIESFLIVGAPRADAWNNAAVLNQVMIQASDLYTHPQVIFNMVDGWRDRLTQLGLPRTLDLPRVKEPERFDGRLGNQVMRAIYPYWRS